MKEKKYELTKWIYWFLLAVAVIGVYKILDDFIEIGLWIKNLFRVLRSFIVGILIAYLLYVPCNKIEKIYLNPGKSKKAKNVEKNARRLAVFVVYFVLIVVLVIAIQSIIPIIRNSIVDLANNFQGYYNMAMENYNNLPEDSILKKEAIVDIVNNLKQVDLKQYINLDTMAEYAKGAISIASKVFEFFIAIIISIYILLERDEMLQFAKKLGNAMFKKSTYIKVENYLKKTNLIFLNFIAGQIYDAIIVSIITSIAMIILKVKYAVLLGIMIGIFNLIPHFGAIIAVILAGIITILTGGIGKAIIMLIVITILQQIDANIINPKILGDSVEISPLLVLFAITIGGAYFGIWGMFLAVPIFAVLKLFITDFIEYKNK